MKSGREMYEYSESNGFSSYIIRTWGIKHFEVIERNLAKDEDVIIPFIGIYHDIYDQAQGHFAVAITNKRLILGQKKFFGGEVVQFIDFKNINDITKQTNFIGNSYIIIDTYKETFKIWFGGKEANNLYPKIEEFLSKQVDKKQSHNNISPADEILKYKQLLDSGIITQEEFELKKKQLLNL